MITTTLGSVRTYDGRPLDLNRSESVFFNDVGFAFVSADVDMEASIARLQALLR